MTKIVDYDPTKGQAMQGDIFIMGLDKKHADLLSFNEEIASKNNILVIAEGEVTGHHHAINFTHDWNTVPSFRDDGLARALEVEAKVNLLEESKQPTRMNMLENFLGTSSAIAKTASFYRDSSLADRLVSDKILTRADLTIGFLKVDYPCVVTHEEHNGIRLPKGIYYIGGQVESVGAEERRVKD